MAESQNQIHNEDDGADSSPFDQPNAAQALGFDSYDAYLKSSLWKKIRRRVLDRDEDRCTRCGGRAVLVHHRAYNASVLSGEDDSYLVSLCEGCHAVVHFDNQGHARPWTDSERCLVEKDVATDYPEPTRHPWRAGVKLPDDHPPQWPRMTAVQRVGWLGAALKIARKRNRRPPAEA